MFIDKSFTLHTVFWRLSGCLFELVLAECNTIYNDSFFPMLVCLYMEFRFNSFVCFTFFAFCCCQCDVSHSNWRRTNAKPNAYRYENLLNINNNNNNKSTQWERERQTNPTYYRKAHTLYFDNHHFKWTTFIFTHIFGMLIMPMRLFDAIRPIEHNKLICFMSLCTIYRSNYWLNISQWIYLRRVTWKRTHW